jgi:sugar-specific transcriptional regulator TrmB
MSDDDAVLALTQLGLTVLESKIYMVLCKYGKLSTKEISKLTKTAQSDVYRVGKKLQQKGLVEKQIENPVSYKPIPFEAGSQFLLQRKEAEYKDLRQKIKKIDQRLKKKTNDTPTISADSHFLMMPRRENIVKKIAEAINRSERKVDLVLSWKRLHRGFTSTFVENTDKAWSKGVKFRIVVETPPDAMGQKKAVEFCRKNPMCNIRFLPSHPKTVVGLYDEKEVFVIVNPREDLLNSPALWSNNQSLITAIQEYFELLWLTSMRQPSEKPDLVSDKTQE